MQTKFDASCELLRCQSGGGRGGGGGGNDVFLQAEPQWATHKWHIINHDWAEIMCELAKSQTKPHNTEIMSPDNLHVTCRNGIRQTI